MANKDLFHPNFCFLYLWCLRTLHISFLHQSYPSLLVHLVNLYSPMRLSLLFTFLVECSLARSLSPAVGCCPPGSWGTSTLVYPTLYCGSVSSIRLFTSLSSRLDFMIILSFVTTMHVAQNLETVRC